MHILVRSWCAKSWHPCVLDEFQAGKNQTTGEVCAKEAGKEAQALCRVRLVERCSVEPVHFAGAVQVSHVDCVGAHSDGMWLHKGVHSRIEELWIGPWL